MEPKQVFNADPINFFDKFRVRIAWIRNLFAGDGKENYVEFDKNGVVTMYGDARVQKRLQVNVGSFKGAGLNPATEVMYGLNGAYRFSATINESIAEASAVPFDIDRTVAPVFTIGWSAGDTTGNALWKLEVLYRALDEDWAETTPDDTIEILVSPSTTSDGLVLTSFTLPLLSSTDAGMIFRLTRLGSDVTDTLATYAYVFGGAIDYTANKLGNPV